MFLYLEDIKETLSLKKYCNFTESEVFSWSDQGKNSSMSCEIKLCFPFENLKEYIEINNILKKY